jgi:hypothetical protein
MKDLIIFEIPIYRCSPEKARNEIKEQKEKDIRFREATGLPPIQYIFPSWRYNEIVGWINVSIWNDRIRAEYWLVKQRIMKWLRRKEFECKGKLFVYHLIRKKNLTSREIFNTVDYKLKSSIKELFPKFHLDSTCFDNIGPFLDWTKIHKKKRDRH